MSKTHPFPCLIGEIDSRHMTQRANRVFLHADTLSRVRRSGKAKKMSGNYQFELRSLTCQLQLGK